MPEDMLQYLGAFIRKSRKDCELTKKNWRSNLAYRLGI